MPRPVLDPEQQQQAKAHRQNKISKILHTIIAFINIAYCVINLTLFFAISRPKFPFARRIVEYGRIYGLASLYGLFGFLICWGFGMRDRTSRVWIWFVVQLVIFACVIATQIGLAVHGRPAAW